MANTFPDQMPTNVLIMKVVELPSGTAALKSRAVSMQKARAVS